MKKRTFPRLSCDKTSPVMSAGLSVFAFFAKSRIYHIFALLLLMAGAEYIAFSLTLSAADPTADGWLSLEGAVRDSRLAVIFGVTLFLTAILLGFFGCDGRSKCSYTLRRLSLPEKSVWAYHALFCALCYLLLWVFQAVFSILLCTKYLAWADPGRINDQTLFLAYYRNSFLHSIVPMEEVWRWVRNLFFVAGLGIETATFSFRRRRGKANTLFVAALYSAIFFARPMGEIASDITMILVFCLTISVNLYTVITKGGPEDNAPDTDDVAGIKQP